MLRTAVDGLKSGDINAVSLYTHDGIELVKGKAEISTGIIDRLKRLNVAFVYKKDNDINISMVYDRNIIAGLHKVLSCFIESNGNNAEILKRYNNEEVRFLRVTMNLQPVLLIHICVLLRKDAEMLTAERT